MNKELLKYFNGDELSAQVWLGKYALKNEKGEYVEQTPEDMHLRMAREFVKAEAKYPKATPEQLRKLSTLGATLNEKEFDLESVMHFLRDFKYIIPQGSIMSALGNNYKLQSLSNCFVIPAPYDSYGGIFKTDQEIAQLEKRRGGVGTNINTLRPDDTPVLNAAGTSTGAHSFMDRYSNTTREVAQNGRRGALMLLMSCLHPDIFKFTSKKKDRTKVTGANVSVQLTDAFMQAVYDNADFICRFPIDYDTSSISEEFLQSLPYNKLTSVEENSVYVMKIKARELYNLIVECAWDNAEPGVAFMDRVINYSPEGVYQQFLPTASNPCGEQWMQPYDACRLLAANLYSLIVNPWTDRAYIDEEKAYEVFYMQQRLADLVVDIEIDYVNRIIEKIKSDPEPDDVKAAELNLWTKVRDTAAASRRTGCGFTALGDAIAALGVKYGSNQSHEATEVIMKIKMRAELDASIDLAILRGTFEGWNPELQYSWKSKFPGDITGMEGLNDFYKMLVEEFPKQVEREIKYGRRNVSWSTVAPTGSVSIVAKLTNYSNTTGGMEPMFMPYYFRNKKVNPSDKDVRIDFIDQNGDAWQTFPVLMGGFKEWIKATYPNYDIENLSKDQLEKLYGESPYFMACANDIFWWQRIRMQSVLQKYTTNAISSTLNLPKNAEKTAVESIYYEAWKSGLKGVTIYRDGCRTGVLVADVPTKDENIVYRDAPKRPAKLDAEVSIVTVKGVKYAVAVGFLGGKPYEVFAFDVTASGRNVHAGKGLLLKQKKGHYDCLDVHGQVIKDIQTLAPRADEQLLTRFVSGMLRHGVNPKFIYQQIDKCELEVVGFGSALKRIIKKHIPEKDLVEGQKCKDCGSSNIRLEEGCQKCMDCGSSKCG
jgi:ribonucleoside-diphosphate reductase alpha chain